MPAQQGQSSLFGKYQAQVMQAHKEAIVNEPQLRGQDLPPGIKNGVARINRIEIVKHKGDEKDQFNGLPEFTILATVVEPVMFDNVKCQGRQIRLSPQIPLYDTPKWASGGSFKEHYDQMVTYLRVYVGKDVWRESGYFEGDTPQQVEANLLRCMKDLSEKGPYINFTTREGKKGKVEFKGGKYWVRANQYPTEEDAKEANPYLENPRTQVNFGDLTTWNPQANGQAFSDNSGHTQDETPPVDEGTLTPDNEFQDVGSPDNSSDETPPTNEGDNRATSTGDEEEVDLDALVASAPDNEADREKLIAIAGQFGIDRETAEGTDTWDDLKNMILEAMSKQEETPEPPQAEVPQKGNTGRYQLLDDKGRPKKDKSKRVLPPVNVEYASVNTKNETVTLKNLEDGGKLIVGKDGKALHVPWNQLLPSE